MHGINSPTRVFYQRPSQELAGRWEVFGSEEGRGGHEHWYESWPEWGRQSESPWLEFEAGETWCSLEFSLNPVISTAEDLAFSLSALGPVSEYSCRIWLNGHLVDEFFAGVAPVISARISDDLAAFSKNVLNRVVICFSGVSAREDVPMQVSLVESGDHTLKNLNLSPEGEKGRLHFSMDTGSEFGEGPWRVSYGIVDLDGNPFSANQGNGWFDRFFSIETTGIDGWSASSPNLYEAELHVSAPGEALLQAARLRFSFSRFRYSDGRFCLNGDEVALRVCRFIDYIPRDNCRELLGRVMASGYNAVWLSDMNIFEELLSLTDELGLMVFAGSPGYSRECGREASLRRSGYAVTLASGHPSLVMWVIGDDPCLHSEDRFDALYEMRMLDPSRPVMMINICNPSSALLLQEGDVLPSKIRFNFISFALLPNSREVRELRKWPLHTKESLFIIASSLCSQPKLISSIIASMCTLKQCSMVSVNTKGSERFPDLTQPLFIAPRTILQANEDECYEIACPLNGTEERKTVSVSLNELGNDRCIWRRSIEIEKERGQTGSITVPGSFLVPGHYRLTMSFAGQEKSTCGGISITVLPASYIDLSRYSSTVADDAVRAGLGLGSFREDAGLQLVLSCGNSLLAYSPLRISSLIAAAENGGTLIILGRTPDLEEVLNAAGIQLNVDNVPLLLPEDVRKILSNLYLEEGDEDHSLSELRLTFPLDLKLKIYRAGSGTIIYSSLSWQRAIGREYLARLLLDCICQQFELPEVMPSPAQGRVKGLTASISDIREGAVSWGVIGPIGTAHEGEGRLGFDISESTQSGDGRVLRPKTVYSGCFSAWKTVLGRTRLPWGNSIYSAETLLKEQKGVPRRSRLSCIFPHKILLNGDIVHEALGGYKGEVTLPFIEGDNRLILVLVGRDEELRSESGEVEISFVFELPGEVIAERHTLGVRH